MNQNEAPQDGVATSNIQGTNHTGSVTPPMYTQPPAASAGTTPGRGLAIAALVIGIVAILGFAIPILNVFSLILALVGLVLAIVALRKYVAKKGLPISGLIINALAALLSLVFIVVYAAGFSAVVNSVQSETEIVPAEESTEQPADGDEATEPEAEADATPESTTEGTRENPVPIGTSVIFESLGTDTWEVTLGAPVLDATAQVLGENTFNEAPPEGLQYAVIPITVTYLGEESGTPWVDLSIAFVSAAGTTHTPSDVFVVGPSPSLFDLNELFTGASGTATETIAIPIDGAANGAWRVSIFLGDEIYFAAQ